MCSPCEHCPFRNDGSFSGLTQDRTREIAHSLMADEGFYCHETVEYEDESNKGKVTNESKLCGGSVVWLEKVRRGGVMANFAYRIAVMFGHKEILQKIDLNSPVYDSFEEFIDSGLD